MLNRRSDAIGAAERQESNPSRPGGRRQRNSCQHSLGILGFFHLLIAIFANTPPKQDTGVKMRSFVGRWPGPTASERRLRAL